MTNFCDNTLFVQKCLSLGKKIRVNVLLELSQGAVQAERAQVERDLGGLGGDRHGGRISYRVDAAGEQSMNMKPTNV